MPLPSAQDASPLAAALTAAAGAAISAAVPLLLAGRPWRGRAHRAHAWGAPLAIAACAAVDFWLTRGAPSFPPAQAVHWLFYVALVGGLLGGLEGIGLRPVRFLRLPVAGLLPVVLLAFQRARYWGSVEGIVWTAGLALLVFVAWSLLAAHEERGSGGGATALGLALATALSAGSYGLGGGAVLAQQAGGLALGLGACALIGLWLRAPGLGTGGVAPFVLLYYGHLWVARWVNELGTPSFVLLSLAPLAALAGRWVPSDRPRLAALLGLAAPPLLAAVALAIEFAGADTSAYG